jgi:imidazoleglycerol-phosphate dehydratase
LKAKGDLKHHVSEDVALALGQTLREILSTHVGINRFGTAYVTMDDALARAVVDLGGRDYCVLALSLSQQQIEDLKTEDITHFFQSLAQASKTNIHIHVLYGDNEHHKIEAAIKALALALRKALTLEPRLAGSIPSAKGVL